MMLFRWAQSLLSRKPTHPPIEDAKLLIFRSLFQDRKNIDLFDEVSQIAGWNCRRGSWWFQALRELEWENKIKGYWHMGEFYYTRVENDA